MKAEDFTVVEYIAGGIASVDLTTSTSDYYARYPCSYTVRLATAADAALIDQYHYANKRKHRLPIFFPQSIERCVHPDQSDLTKVRYLDARHRYVSMKPGKYIRKFHPELDHADISARWGAYFAPATVMFAATSDEIERVYLEGPTSCMSHELSEYDSHVHPVRAYGAGDLQVAYIERDDNITARALIWPEKNTYGRLYGDEVRLGEALQKLGYVYDGEGFRGARLLKIYNDEHDGWVVPYVDYCTWAEEQDKFLILGGGKRGVWLQYTNGLSVEVEEEEQGEYCHYYEEYRHEATSEVIINERGHTVCWCHSAIEYNAFWCPHLGSYVSDDIGIDVDDELRSPAWVNKYAGYCDFTDRYFLSEDLLTTADGCQISKEHFKNMDADERPELEKIAA